jgi:hypothetical protein
MEAQNQIIGKIIRFQQKKLIYQIISGILKFFIYLLLIWLSSFIADSVFYFSQSVRWFVVVLNGSITIYFFYTLIFSSLIDLIQLSDKNDLTPVTRSIGVLFPSIEDRLTNIYQLITLRPPGSSSSITYYAIERYAKELENTEFSKEIKLGDFLFPYSIVIPVILGSLVLTYMLSDKLMLSMKRILNPMGEYAEVPWYEFTVNPGNTNIIIDQTLNISAKFKGPELETCLLQLRFRGDVVYQSKLMRGQADFYEIQIDDIKRPFEYYLQGFPRFPAEWKDKLVSQVFTINTLIPPLVNEVQVVVTPPSYTNLPKQFLEVNVGDIIAYPGSIINISAQANKALNMAKIVFSDGKEIYSDIRGNKFNFSFTVNIGKTYLLTVNDTEGLYNREPIEYTITKLEDLYPAVEITEPGEDVEIAADGALNLIFEGNDDFGFNKLHLHYQIQRKVKAVTDSTWHQVPIYISTPGDKYFQQSYFWNFATLPVSFDDGVKYYATLSDNDIINGPKISRSDTYYIRFPSVEQLFEDFNSAQNENLNAAEDLAAESEDLKKDLEKISREMKREKELDWERKRSLETALEKQEEVQKKLKKIEEDLNKAIEKLESNQLFSPEILEKYNKLQDLFHEIATPELLQSMKDLEKSLNLLDKKQTQIATEKFKLDQQRFKENLERTLALFKRVKLEQELDKMVKMAEALERDQSEISEALAKNDALDPEKRKSLIKKEEDQQDLLKNLNNSLSKIMKNDLMNEYPKVMNSLENSKQIGNELQDQMAEFINTMETTDQNTMQSNSGEMDQQLAQMQANLKNAQKSMLENSQQKILSKMKKVTDNLLKLSKDEEQLIEETKQLSNFSDKFPEIAGSQQQIIENMFRTTRDIIDLSHETFFLPPGMSKSLSNAHSNMKKSVSELENRKQKTASNFQGHSMAEINKSIMQMQNSMEALAAAKSGLGFEQYLQQMQQLSGQQGKLNQESLNFFNTNKGKLSLEQQGQLMRMSAEQKAIQQSLENLAEGMQNRSDVLGSLDNMAKEMEEVVKELHSLRLDRGTIERQQKIFSRMLDAQKSVREKEYSKKRLAETGKEYIRRSPDDPTDLENQRMKQLKLDLIRALNEGYNPDYEKLIEEYFRTLNLNLPRK